MTGRRGVVVAVVVVALASAGLYGLQRARDWRLFSKDGQEVVSAMGSDVLVMHTPGGLLEVSTIRATEQFDKKFIYSIPGLGIQLGETVAHIRVPVVYRYHIELARNWDVYRKGGVFTVITPRVEPTLPVAVDLGGMEKDVGGSWILVPFNREDDLDDLEREITARLASKARSRVYLDLQREAARMTVTGFVRKWLVTQAEWRESPQPRIEVVFPQ